MITPEKVWNSIDKIAEQAETPITVLAKNSGLDFSTLSPSRRARCWPSLKTVAKVLNSRNMTLAEWAAIVEGEQP